MTIGIFHPVRITVIALVMTTAWHVIAGLTTRHMVFLFIGGLLGGIISDILNAVVNQAWRAWRR